MICWRCGDSSPKLSSPESPSVMANTMRNTMEAPVYPAATLACVCDLASISAVDTHWVAATNFGTKRQRLKERFD